MMLAFFAVSLDRVSAEPDIKKVSLPGGGDDASYATGYHSAHTAPNQWMDALSWITNYYCIVSHRMKLQNDVLNNKNTGKI